MLYFKNVDLAEKYHVSLGAVRNWIEAARAGKLDLALHAKDDRFYVANTAHNTAVMQALVEDRKKYRTRQSHKILTPRPEFYRLFGREQIYDLVTNIEVHREIPRQYNYFGEGADSWDEYIARMEREDVASNLTMSRLLLARNEQYIHDYTNRYEKVNIIDIGVGNLLPMRIFLSNLLTQRTLHRYIALDISPRMLDIAARNVKTWFGDDVAFEGRQLDITRERFSHLLADDYLKSATDSTANLIFFLGGTLQNFRKRDVPLQVISNSMGTHDLLIHTQKLDSPATRGQFDFSSQPGVQTLPPIHALVVELLDITPDLYELEIGYDKIHRERYERIRFTSSATIRLDFGQHEHLIHIDKGDALLLWRASQDTALDVIHQLAENDFCLLQSSQTEDQEYILTISKVK